MTIEAEQEQVAGVGAGGWRHQIRRWLPPLGTIALLAYLIWSTDLDAALAAFRQADVAVAFVVLGLVTVITWLSST